MEETHAKTIRNEGPPLKGRPPLMEAALEDHTQGFLLNPTLGTPFQCIWMLLNIHLVHVLFAAVQSSIGNVIQTSLKDRLTLIHKNYDE